MLCILYVNAVGFLLALIGAQLERLRPEHVPRRWIWCAVLVLSVALPGYYRYHHTLAVAGAGVGAPLLGAREVRQLRTVDVVIAYAWPATSALIALWAAVNAGWVARIVHAARRQAPASVEVDGVPVVVTDALGPATTGVWRPLVVLPRWALALPPAQRRYVVRHEDEHRRSHDARLLCLASLAVILSPWDLALWWQLRRLSLAIEMDCDQRVVASLGDTRAYARLLLDVAQASSRGPRLQPALAGRAGMLERRLTALLDPAPLRLAQRVALPLLAAALLALVLTTPHPVIATHAHAGAHAAAR